MQKLLSLKEKCESFGPKNICLFDLDLYRVQAADIPVNALEAFSHYLEKGWTQNYAPSLNFDGSAYLEDYPDVKAASVNPLLHYVEYGAAEGRRIRSEPLIITAEAAALFDSEYYAEAYPDVASSNQDLLRHYFTVGWKEGKNPSREFSTSFYLSSYEDARTSGLPPLTHYVLTGREMFYSTCPAAPIGVAKKPSNYTPAQVLPATLKHETNAAKKVSLTIHDVKAGRITGILRSEDEKATSIEVLVGDKVIASVVCPEVKKTSKGVVPLREFRIRLPLRHRYDSPNDLNIRTHGQSGPAHRLAWRGHAHPRILIVANASNVNDGSRIYRAELPAVQLRASGVEVTVLGQEDAFEKLRHNQLAPGDFDVVIFQRVPITSSSYSLLHKAKEQGTRVLYDVDDLMFKPWRRAEMGVVRSGTVKMDDKSYEQSLAKRLQLLMHCDGAICSTSFLQRELNSLGIPVILSRNAVDDSHFHQGALRLSAPAQTNLRILFMSGTPTHDADFERIRNVVEKALQTSRTTQLTILGELKDVSLKRLANVKRIPVVSRTEMFRIIAQHDLVLVPLERTSFNMAKSSLKFMECGAAGVPVIASSLYEFSRDIQKSGGGMIVKNEDDWYSAINLFINNPALSHKYGLKAYEYCRQNYSISSRKDYLWNEICRFDEYLRKMENTLNNIKSNIKLNYKIG
ncbi:MAG: glycosyltransferase [Asticcacaulis sp.]